MTLLHFPRGRYKHFARVDETAPSQICRQERLLQHLVRPYISKCNVSHLVVLASKPSSCKCNRVWSSGALTACIPKFSVKPDAVHYFPNTAQVDPGLNSPSLESSRVARGTEAHKVV